ncbi:hypothetical protein ACFWAX_37020, partial [Streptomyces sp. NPDC059956]
CYGGAFDYQSSQEGYWPLEGHAPTSSRCADINVKSNTTRRVRACFWTGNGHTCNAFRTVPAGQWTVAASNVLDGTRFYLDFEDNKVGTGLVAA